MPESTKTGLMLRDADRRLLDRVRAKHPEPYPMGYGETGATLRLTDAGLVTWSQDSPFVASVRLVEADR